MNYMLSLANRIASDAGKTIEGENHYWEITENRLANACITQEDYDQILVSVRESLAKIVSSVYRPHN